MAVPGFGRKFWTITSCTCPWRRCESAMASSAVDPVGPVLADADEDARGERDGQLTGGLEGGQAALGGLVRSAPVAGEVAAEGLDHHPLRRRDGAQAGELVGGEGAGVGVGEHAGLVEHQLGHGHEVVDGARVAVVGEPLGGDRVALLGRLTEGEEGLVAADAGAGAGQGGDLLRGEVRRVEPGRRLGEGAVAAAVATQHGERDEDLGRVGHPGAVGGVTHRPGLGHQRLEWCVQRQRHVGTIPGWAPSPRRPPLGRRPVPAGRGGA